MARTLERITKVTTTKIKGQDTGQIVTLDMPPVVEYEGELKKYGGGSQDHLPWYLRRGAKGVI